MYFYWALYILVEGLLKDHVISWGQYHMSILWTWLFYIGNSNQCVFLCLIRTLLSVLSYCLAYFLPLSFVFPILIHSLSSHFNYVCRGLSQPFGLCTPTEYLYTPNLKCWCSWFEVLYFLSVYFLLWGLKEKQNKLLSQKLCKSTPEALCQCVLTHHCISPWPI